MMIPKLGVVPDLADQVLLRKVHRRKIAGNMQEGIEGAPGLLTVAGPFDV